MRVFDPGPFYTVIGVVLSATEELVQTCMTAKQTTGRLPFRRSLAAVVYGLNLFDGTSNHPSAARFARDVAQVLGTGGTARGL